MALRAEDVYAILKNQIQQGGGTPGPAGVGIQKIEKTNTEGLVDTYTITYTDGSSTTYTVTNGKDGKDGEDANQLPFVSHGASDTTFQLPPNELHTWGEVPTLTLTLGAEASSVANGYWFSFDSGDTATTLSLPDTVKTDIVIEPNMHYECLIVGKYMTFSEWEATS